jgi:hypothetical protein
VVARRIEHRTTQGAPSGTSPDCHLNKSAK